jgi:hypothetical protein
MKYFKWTLKFHYVVLIVLLLALLFYNLVTISWITNEALTAQEIKDKATANSNSTVLKNLPQPDIKQKKINVQIQDTYSYNECVKNPAPPPPEPPDNDMAGLGGRMQQVNRIRPDNGYRAFIPFTATFTQLNPNMNYYISGTSEGAPSQDVTVQSFPLTYVNPINPSDCNGNNAGSAMSKIIPANNPTTVTIPIETGKFNGFIVVAPSTSSLFPQNFTLTIGINDNLQLQLYGQYASGLTNAKSVPNNTLIDTNTISNTGFPSNAYDASDNVIKIAGVNLGGEPMVIANIGAITDKNNSTIGSVTNTNNQIIVQCTNSANITGIIIYLGHLYVA